MNKAERDDYAKKVRCVAFDLRTGECLSMPYTHCDCWMQAAAQGKVEESDYDRAMTGVANGAP